MPTLRRRKAKDQDKENTDAMVDDGDDDEQEFDDGDHESDADFEGSPAKKKPKDDEELPQAPPLMDGGAAPQAPIDGGAARCQANVDVGDGCGVPQEAMTEPKDILRLDPLVVNQIAAGEVVTKPPNALKELLENALDAGASTISVEVEGGGLDRLRICDDGCGVKQADLPLLCERHATSKLSKFEDLESIETFGFRGEALASVSYVAKVHVTTKTREDECAYKQSFRDGAPIGKPKACAAPDGTTITVEDMFHNFSVRRKILRGQVSELYHQMVRVCGAYAVHYASKAISCRKAGHGSDLVTTGGTTLEALTAVHGSTTSQNLCELKCGQEGTDERPLHFSLTGYVSKRCVETTRGTPQNKKDRFTLFINDRLVESTAIKRCVDEVYSNRPDHVASTTSKPFAYLSLKVPGSHVDVNVHPTKKEVHFLYEAELCQALQRALEPLVAKHADTRTLAQLSDKPSRRKSSSQSQLSQPSQTQSRGAFHSESQPSQKQTTNTQPSQRPEKMIRADYRDQQIDSFFPASQKTPAPPPKAVREATRVTDASQEDSPEDWFASQDDSPPDSVSYTHLTLPTKA